MNDPAATPTTSRLEPFALRDAPALIEAVFPAQKVSFEAQRERKAGAGRREVQLAVEAQRVAVERRPNPPAAGDVARRDRHALDRDRRIAELRQGRSRRHPALFGGASGEREGGERSAMIGERPMVCRLLSMGAISSTTATSR